MSFHRMIETGSWPERNSSATAVPHDPVALVLEVAQRRATRRSTSRKPSRQRTPRRASARRDGSRRPVRVPARARASRRTARCSRPTWSTQVADVVDRRREPEDVLAVEGRHERPVRRRPISSVVSRSPSCSRSLICSDQIASVAREGIQEVDEQLRDRHGVLGRRAEQVEELAVLRLEVEGAPRASTRCEGLVNGATRRSGSGSSARRRASRSPRRRRRPL